MMELPDGPESVKIGLAIQTQYWRMTDSQIDRQPDTLRQQRPRYAHMRHAAKNRSTFAEVMGKN